MKKPLLSLMLLCSSTLAWSAPSVSRMVNATLDQIITWEYPESFMEWDRTEETLSYHEEAQESYRLLVGHTYHFVGACLEECSLETTLLSAAGDALSTDAWEASQVIFTPARSGPYTLKLHCLERGGCTYAVALLEDLE